MKTTTARNPNRLTGPIIVAGFAIFGVVVHSACASAIDDKADFHSGTAVKHTTVVFDGLSDPVVTTTGVSAVRMLGDGTSAMTTDQVTTSTTVGAVSQALSPEIPVVPVSDETYAGEPKSGELKYGLVDEIGFAIPGVASHEGYFDVHNGCVQFVVTNAVGNTSPQPANQELGDLNGSYIAKHAVAFPVGLSSYLEQRDSAHIPPNRWLGDQGVFFADRSPFGLVAMEIDGFMDERLILPVPRECPREALLIGEAWPRQ